MYDGFVHVDENHDPIVYEGTDRAKLSVMNGGPATIELRCWNDTKPTRENPDSKVELRPGNIKTVSGSLLRLRIKNGYLPQISKQTNEGTAAAGWRLLKT
jgi:hypothetical protein